jgi:hypothetical protein
VAFGWVIILLSGCSPSSWNKAERARDEGDTVTAVRYAVRTLLEEPGYEDAIRYLQSTIPGAYDTFESRAERSASRGLWDDTFELSPQILEESGQEIVFEIRNVEEKIRHARDMAAEMHYTEGIGFEADGEVKLAAKAFARTMSYLPNYKDARSRYRENRQAAVQRVAILPFRNLTGRRLYRETGAVIADRVILETMKDPDNLEFMELVSRDNMDEVMDEIRFGQSGYVDASSAAEVGKLLGVNAFIVGSITSVSADYPPDVIERYEDTKKISAGKDRPSRTVRATVTIVRREAFADVSCIYQIVDVRTGKILSTGEAEGSVGFATAFGRYRGSKEALSRRSRQLCAVRESYPPTDDQLVGQAARDVARKLALRVSGYFR